MSSFFGKLNGSSSTSSSSSSDSSSSSCRAKFLRYSSSTRMFKAVEKVQDGKSMAVGKAKGSSSEVTGRRYKSRQMVFLKKRTEVEPPFASRSKGVQSSQQLQSKSSSVTPQISTSGSNYSPRFISYSPASRKQEMTTPQKAPLCPYQYLYYLLLLEYTNDKSFKIIDPTRAYPRNKSVVQNLN